MTSKLTKNKIPIDYTRKGFGEIKEDLVSYIKRYYPDTYKDFNKSSFGSMMLDLVSYVGDQLHYYSDHNANEANVAFAKEASNVLQGLQSLGSKISLVGVSSGMLEIFFPIPADSFGINIDKNYKIRSHAGSTYRSQGGTIFTQIEDVVISEENSEIIGHKATDNNSLSYFLLKTSIPVISGEEKVHTVEVGKYRRFLKLEIPDPHLTEILKVEDLDKNEYYEVDYLTQNTIYKPVRDSESTDTRIASRLKAVPVPRRFTSERSLDKTYLVFGYGSETDLKTNSVSEPSKVAAKVSAKSYISTPTLDPTNLISSNKLGVAPQETTLAITYRSNSTENSNAAVGTVTQVINPIISFEKEQLLDTAKVNYIKGNIQVYNEEPINGNVSIANTEELKRRHLGNYAAQNRAVTRQDYVSAVYSMPNSYGSIKRAAILTDKNDLRRNLNLYLMAESAAGKFEAPSTLLKQNVKTWIDSVRMISDSVDIFDAHVINLAIEIKATAAIGANATALISVIKRKLYEELTAIPPDIGEPFLISEVYKIMRNMPEVESVPQRDGVIITSPAGTKYSDYSYDVNSNMSLDESYIHIPENAIWEIKFIDDIIGTIR